MHNVAQNATEFAAAVKHKLAPQQTRESLIYGIAVCVTLLDVLFISLLLNTFCTAFTFQSITDTSLKKLNISYG